MLTRPPTLQSVLKQFEHLSHIKLHKVGIKPCCVRVLYDVFRFSDLFRFCVLYVQGLRFVQVLCYGGVFSVQVLCCFPVRCHVQIVARKMSVL